MTSLLPDLPQVRANKETHRRLEEYLQKVATYLDEEIGKAHVIPRTHRHLYGRVVRLQVAQDDHLEKEEEFVLPIIREKLTKDEQRRIAQQILVDDEAENKLWVLDWVSRHITTAERKLSEQVISCRPRTPEAS